MFRVVSGRFRALWGSLRVIRGTFVGKSLGVILGALTGAFGGLWDEKRSDCEQKGGNGRKTARILNKRRKKKKKKKKIEGIEGIFIEPSE